MNGTWLYILLPMTSAIACIYLLARLYHRNAEFAFLSLFTSLALMNIVQVIGYLIVPHSLVISTYFADAYLITAYFFLAQLLLFSVALSGETENKRFTIIVYTFPIIFTLFHFSGLMIEGYHYENNTLLHNDGKLAWCFDIFMLVSCLATATTLWKNMKNNFEDKFIASKNIIALVSFIPMILIFSVIVLLSRTPYAIPVAAIGPIVTLYTAVTFYYLLRERVVAISVGVGFFINRLKLANQLLEMKNSKEEIKSFTKAIEKQFIIEAMEVYGGDIQATAEHLGMNHTTLRNKIKEYELAEEKPKSQAAAM